ncbi:SDR family oxidoreductase [Rahnella sp. Lac-M11]|jgi:NAD(P)-dependent dehydrogenase (short-subunit alcohol dehydrogenase family)|uniref:SDR family oxidoreductase n=1 Tax=Rahnella contaminans TaxID=2703882 RepID=A0A6M2B822_9GAMM|nr:MULTISPECIES: SDR family oxidoreductase [Yersiniaceae]MCS3424535.1 NAD(P)-dependent dehydrogenase (short-subunit alcohol dehydrogenase family) [Rahnella sp. BIGb0603]NGX88793.1 SDR family oxidoreductase [Rahnella contaminans]CFQ45910.1 putative dehydrogenase/reductase [Yersinia aleksiciae]
MTTQSLKGRIALVTGGTTGLGFGAAKRLIEHGATVYITGRRQNVLDDAISKLGTSARAIRADVSSKEDMLRAAATIKTEQGHLDILFANAGGGHATPLEQLTEEQIDSELSTNIKGVVLTMQSMLDVLRDGSSVVLNASITADMGLPGFAVYAATKAAVRSLARSWTTDLKGRNIRVNTISPGVVPTEGYSNEQKMSDSDIASYAERVSTEIPAGRVGTAEDIADALIFLVSDSSTYIRGIDLIVDGGMTRVYAGKN